MRRRGFTLIELLVVMAIVATLLTIAAPRYFGHVEKAREAALRETLAVVRDAIDKYHADNGRYPSDLQVLVQQRYLARAPRDPMTEHVDDWTLVPAPNEPGIWDLHSSSAGVSRQLEPASGESNRYVDW